MIEQVANKYLKFLEKCNQIAVQKEFDFIVKINKEYDEIIEKVNKKKLILKRLKALVINWKKDINKPKSDIELTEFFAEFFLNLENRPDLTGNIKTVGYLVSEGFEYGEVKFGASICKPSDYDSFNRKLGLAIAYENMQIHPIPVFPERRYLCSSNSDVSYIWLDKPQLQFSKFAEDAYAYFRVYKKEKN